MTLNANNNPFVFEATFDDDDTESAAREFRELDHVGEIAEASTGSVLASPFVLELEMGDETVTQPSEDDEAFAEALVDLHDHEFDDAVAELFADAQVVAEKLVGEVGDDPQALEAALQRHYEGMVQASERGIEDIAQELGEADEESLTDEFLEEFARGPVTIPEGLDGPEQEDFFRKIVRKARRAVRRVRKSVGRAARKVGGFVKRLNPIRAVLSRLKKLVRPFLNRVIGGVINRLPPKLRPIARRLVRKITREAPEETFEIEEDGLTAAVSPIALAREFDLVLADLVTEGDESEAASEYETASDIDSGAMERIEEAREAFIEAFESGDESRIEPKTEEFVAAILPIARTAIKVVGRGRVVKTIAGYLTPLIRRAVGPKYAGALSHAITDQGLRMLSLEAGETPPEGSPTDPRIAAEAMANTIEETTLELAPLLTEEDEELEGEVVSETFSQFSAENFPHTVIDDEIESFASRGTFVRRPARGRRRYKKFSQIFDVTISPSQARSVYSFGGVSLHRFLVDVMGQSPTATIKARMHVYEAVRGTTLSALTYHEKGVPGLGSGRKRAWSQIHPLSTRAAGVLVKDPALGRDMSARWTSSRHRIQVGQRFMYLEIRGAAPQTIDTGGGTTTAPERPEPKRPTTQPEPSRPAVVRAGQVLVTIDFKRGKVRASVYFAERSAAEVARSLRSGRNETAIVKAVFSALSSAERQANANPDSLVRVIGSPADFIQRATRNVSRTVKRIGKAASRAGRAIRGWLNLEAEALDDILEPVVAEEDFLPAKGKIAKVILKRLAAFAANAIKGRLMELRDDWIKAQGSRVDGLTVRLQFDLPDEVTEIAKLASPALYAASELTLSIVPGRRL